MKNRHFCLSPLGSYFRHCSCNIHHLALCEEATGVRKKKALVPVELHLKHAKPKAEYFNFPSEQVTVINFPSEQVIILRS